VRLTHPAIGAVLSSLHSISVQSAWPCSTRSQTASQQALLVMTSASAHCSYSSLSAGHLHTHRHSMTVSLIDTQTRIWLCCTAL